MITDKIKSFFKKKDYTFEVLTNVHGVHQYGDVDLAKKTPPEFFKKLPPTIEIPYHRPLEDPFREETVPTMKYCPAMQEIYTKGIIMKAWCDIKLAVEPDGKVTIHSAFENGPNRGAGSHHQYIQRIGYLKDFAHFKIHSPYWFKTSYYRRFLFSGAYQHNEELVRQNIYIVNGVLDFYTQYANEINMLLPIKKEKYTITFNMGDPLVHLIPLDEDPLKVKHTLISEQEYHSMRTAHPKFIGNAKIFKQKISESH